MEYNLEVAISNKHLISFLACPVFSCSTDFKLTPEEKSILMGGGLKKVEDHPKQRAEGVKVSEDHEVLGRVGLERVKHFMVTFTKQFVKDELKILDEFYLTQSWWTENEKGSKHHGHTHPNTLLSMVYYVHAESGDIAVSSETNNLFPNFDFTYNISEWNIYNAKSWTIPVRTGDIVIFPGWVNHTTTPNEHETPRVILGANFFARGKFGKYENTNLIEVK